MEGNCDISGFLLEKRPGMHQPQRMEKAKILIANTPMDTDKVSINMLNYAKIVANYIV